MIGEASPDSSFLSIRGSLALILAVTYLPPGTKSSSFKNQVLLRIAATGFFPKEFY